VNVISLAIKKAPPDTRPFEVYVYVLPAFQHDLFLIF